MKIYNQFINKYPVSKTLRFSLIPQGETLDHIQKQGFIEADLKRSEDYCKVKTLLDRLHKQFIEDTLLNVEMDWEELAEAYLSARKYHDENNRKALLAIQDKYRKELMEWFVGKRGEAEFKKAQKEKYASLFKADIFKKLLLDSDAFTEEEKALASSFDKFLTYFTGYHETRKNVYSTEPIATSVAYRIVNDNFPKFLDACQVFSTINHEIPNLDGETWNKIEALPQLFAFYESIEDSTELEKHNEALALAKTVYQPKAIHEIFNVAFFNHVLSQREISLFNQLIGGIVTQNSEHPKLQGFNELINLSTQQNEAVERQLKGKPHKIAPLFKQILSDRSTLSFIQDMYSTDEDTLEAIDDFKAYLMDNDIENRIHAVADYLQSHEGSQIFVNHQDLQKVSHLLFGDWSALRDHLQAFLAKDYKQPLKKKDVEAIDKVFKQDISLETLNQANTYDEMTALPQIGKAWSEKIREALKEVQRLSQKSLPLKLTQNAEKTEVKALLDGYIDLYHILTPLLCSEEHEKDLTFYQMLEGVTDCLSLLIPLYNKVRNYVTRKPYSTSKYKLNFNIPTLANGWDLNKENEYGTFLFVKEGQYYLGIANAKNKPSFDQYSTDESSLNDNIEDSSSYQKVVYKQFPSFSKMLPKCVFTKDVKEHFEEFSTDATIESKSFLKPFTVPYEVYRLNTVVYDGKKKFQIDYLRNSGDEEGYYKALHTWIDFAKAFLKTYKSTSIYDFSMLKDTQEYTKLDEFYNDVNDVCYALKFTPLPDTLVETMVKEGQLYLFQIYNKDFSPYSTGIPNLHTLYWRALFMPENLQDVVAKLNGQAEIFYRPKSDMEVFTHNIGEKLVNKTYKVKNSETGEEISYPIPDEIYIELNAYFNGNKAKSELSEEALALSDKIKPIDVHYPIIKNRRYTKDSFFFHVPITLNYKAHNSGMRFNQEVCDQLVEAEDIHVIGIDRGEKNLLYAVVVNGKGDIVDMQSLNVINQYDYQKKLVQREKERQDSRQSWTSVGKIKDLKKGYLSQAVHTIAEMMVRYNAVIALENLNFRFKEKRQGIAERSVYQQFEKMLIDKLNYLAFKTYDELEPGGILKAYQLTEQFDSFQKMGIQSGFLFYVPASYTSKIDPLTGLVNPFAFKKLKKIDDKRDFLEHFTSLYYDATAKAFLLDCDLSREGFPIQVDLPRKKWTFKIAGERDIYHPKLKSHEYINLEKKMDSLLQEEGIEQKPGVNILPKLIESDNAVKKMTDIISSLLKLRNMDSDGRDYIISPVANKDGIYFDSRNYNDEKVLPKDSDANGAYHIALKGLCLISMIKQAGKGVRPKLGLTNKDWLTFVQERDKK